MFTYEVTDGYYQEWSNSLHHASNDGWVVGWVEGGKHLTLVIHNWVNKIKHGNIMYAKI